MSRRLTLRGADEQFVRSPSKLGRLYLDDLPQLTLPVGLFLTDDLMNIAFLFNSDHPSLGSFYGDQVMDRILSARVLQGANRHMRVSYGDILTYMAAARSSTPTTDYLVMLCRAVYQPKHFDFLIHDRLEATHGKATVFCWVFQNMTASIGKALHTKLRRKKSYLGAMDVDFSEHLHLYFFRNSLSEKYRLYADRWTIFYDMGQNDDPDIELREKLERSGFSIDYEDSGARGTIFDNYDTLEHFKRVEDFKKVFSGFKDLDADYASDLALSLEELHPKLFNAFAAAARTLERAETEEDYAQAALSGRRLLERIADYLFPPREEMWNQRKVGRPEYRNRLWAYIEQTTTELTITDPNILTTLGKEADRLVELFNIGLHANPTEDKVKAAFSSLLIWLSNVINLSPEAARRPYLAYEQELMKLLGDSFRQDEEWQ